MQLLQKVCCPGLHQGHLVLADCPGLTDIDKGIQETAMCFKTVYTVTIARIRYRRIAQATDDVIDLQVVL